MMTSPQGNCYFRCLRPPDVDAIKNFDKDDQAAKHQDKKNDVLQPGHLLVPSTSGGLEHPK